jgi:SurA-like protein
MSRLSLFIVASVVLAAVLSGCGASSPTAATVGSHDISRADLNRDLRAIRDNKPLQDLAKQQGGTFSNTKGTVTAGLTAGWLGQLIQLRVIEDLFDARHLTVTAEDRANAQQQAAQFFGSQDAFNAFPSSFRTRFLDAFARNAALTRSVTATADQHALATKAQNELKKAKVDPRYGTTRITAQGFEVVPPAAPNPREKPKTTTTTALNPAGASPTG